LAPVKEIAQIAACIGRDFDYDLLAAASGMPEDGLRSALEALRHAEFVIARGLAGEQYSFKHALVRDTGFRSFAAEAARCGVMVTDGS
jgi:predicted ATPase